MKRFATGLFSTAYLDGEHVILKSICRAKECLALFGFGESEYWPQIECIDSYMYKMPFYQPLKKSSLDADQWALYQALKAHADNFQSWLCKESECDRYDRLYNYWQPFPFIQEALEQLRNYGDDIAIEISPRNVKTLNGRLVLLDLFYFRSQCSMVRTRGRSEVLRGYFS